MKTEPLMFQHPIDHLELYDLDPSKWDWASPPPIYLADDFAPLVPLVPYMPPLLLVEAEGSDRIECLEDGQCRYFFKLTCEVNELWQSCFEKRRGNVDVTLDRNTLILRCDPKDFEKHCEEICRSAIYQATNDYRRERDKLVRLVFERMLKQERREHTKAEIQAQLENYRQRRQERSLVAQQNGWSVPFVVQNFNEHYREILENKFVWWAKVLDDTTVREYKAKFEMELLFN